LAFERDSAPKYAKARRLARLLGHLDDQKSINPFLAGWNSLLPTATGASPHMSFMKRAYAEEVQDLNFLRQSPPGSYHQGSAWANAAQQLGGSPWKCLLPLWPLELVQRCYQWASAVCEPNSSSSSSSSSNSRSSSSSRDISKRSRSSLRDRQMSWWKGMLLRLRARAFKWATHESPSVLSSQKVSSEIV